ncbi:MAG: hypothetical protein LBH04_03300 [Tannerellaceae bacterium]|jgi:hypothetical protein|nr:hypothetical protein [Tannerellaceae bacterium]
MTTTISRIFSFCILIAAIASVSFTASAQEAVLKKMEGAWKYTMPDMGGGGSFEGKCIIATVNGETKATLVSPMGEIISGPLKLDKDKYVGDLNIESDMGSFQMKIAFKFDGDRLLQELISDFGEMPAIPMTRLAE